MRHLAGMTIIVTITATVGFVVWRVVRGVEEWFVYSGAGDVLMWAAVAAGVLVVLALALAVGAGAAGFAARQWIVVLESHQRVESVVETLRPRVITEEHSGSRTGITERLDREVSNDRY